MATLENAKPASAAARPSAGVGSWPWVIQRLSAVLLIVFLGVHWWISHFASVGEEITFIGVTDRLKEAILVFVDGGMLLIALYHALNGARNVILDFTLGRRTTFVINAFFIILGIVAFIYGLNALLPFTTGTALFYR